MRVLSLLSASTEIVHRLGCSHLLVGRSHGCDDPPLATLLPIATAPRVDPNAPSADLDAAVRAQSVSGGPIYHIHNELVRALKPDVILTQEQCRICAVTPEDVVEACAEFPTVKMVTIMPVTLDDVLGDIMTIARALSVEERGSRLVKLLKQRLETVRQLVNESNVLSRPKLVHIEWIAPLMGSGYWIAECAEAAGCEMVHGRKGGHSPTLSGLSQLATAQMLVIAPCGFSIERTNSELKTQGLLESEDWKGLDAVRNRRVYVADGNLYFNRSSCGVVETAEMLAEMAWPELKGVWGHHGKHWVALEELEAFCGREGAAKPLKAVALAPAMGSKQEVKAGQPVAVAGRGFELPAEHVQCQIDLLRSGRFAEAFGMNSAANRARIGSAGKFEAVVQGSPSFVALANPANACESIQVSEQEDGKHAVSVRVESAGERLAFVFEVSKTEAGCETEGVRVVC